MKKNAESPSSINRTANCMASLESKYSQLLLVLTVYFYYEIYMILSRNASITKNVKNCV